MILKKIKKALALTLTLSPIELESFAPIQLGSTSTMQTSIASSISIKNKTDNFIIKTLNQRMTTAPFSAYY
ncbi:MAG: hypothetical protein ACRC3Y_02360 [Romboutsia sp.]|uniref:hypothetical protein n=1 Tax=Romboutsia sp. TaxID=1965302 RepID=UPI003F2FB019